MHQFFNSTLQVLNDYSERVVSLDIYSFNHIYLSLILRSIDTIRKKSLVWYNFLHSYFMYSCNVFIFTYFKIITIKKVYNSNNYKIQISAKIILNATHNYIIYVIKEIIVIISLHSHVICDLKVLYILYIHCIYTVYFIRLFNRVIKMKEK